METRTGAPQRHVIHPEGKEVAMYATDPAARAPSFVLVHGIGTSHRYFAPLHFALASVGETVSIDLPGFGRGGNDPIARASWCQRIVSQAADGELLELPGHRHLVQFSAPSATAAGIVEFVRSRPGVESRLV
jgi:pimeloyl-ACP methyl ester carboxylesterase